MRESRLVVGRVSNILCRAHGSRPPAQITWYLGERRIDGTAEKVSDISCLPIQSQKCGDGDQKTGFFLLLVARYYVPSKTVDSTNRLDQSEQEPPAIVFFCNDSVKTGCFGY